MSEAVYPINIWINEERYERLQRAGIEDLAKGVLAGLKVVQAPATEAQKDLLLQRFPTARCDTATTKTIELLPRPIKDRLFELIVQRRSVDVMEAFLASWSS